MYPPSISADPDSQSPVEDFSSPDPHKESLSSDDVPLGYTKPSNPRRSVLTPSKSPIKKTFLFTQSQVDDFSSPDPDEEVSSSDDVPLVKTKLSIPVLTPSKSPIKRTAYLVSPMRNQPGRSSPPQIPSTQSCSLSPLQNTITIDHLNSDDKRCFFTNLVNLLKYDPKVDVKLVKFDERIRVFAFYGVFPDPEWLSVLVKSRDEQDIRVSHLSFP